MSSCLHFEYESVSGRAIIVSEQEIMKFLKFLCFLELQLKTEKLEASPGGSKSFMEVCDIKKKNKLYFSNINAS